MSEKNDSPSKEALNKSKKRGLDKRAASSPHMHDKAERKNSMPLPIVREGSKGDLRMPSSARGHSSSELPAPRGTTSSALTAKQNESEEAQGYFLIESPFCHWLMVS